MVNLKRSIEDKIKQKLFKGKIIVLYGARQVGKTTLSKRILSEFGKEGLYLNCELISVQQGLENLEAEKLKTYIGNYKIIVLDEAQNIEHIGKKLKLMIDTFPKIQIIATGSSSFELANKISEPLTGRTFTFLLYPFSLREMKQKLDQFAINAKVENLLRFGSYPEVYYLSEDEAIERLDEISSNYLYKDVLKFEGIKKSSVIKNLLQCLSLQISNEVSYDGLAKKLGINRLTVQKYIDILEKNFIIFKLNAFARNKRKEISKSVKIYFNDLGIRNSLIQNFNPLNIRNDVGALWENFCIIERMKSNLEKGKHVNSYFWRTYDQKEIDYVEESGGKIRGYEFKWNKLKSYTAPKDFIASYKGTVEKIDKDNYWKFL